MTTVAQPLPHTAGATQSSETKMTVEPQKDDERAVEQSSEQDHTESRKRAIAAARALLFGKQRANPNPAQQKRPERVEQVERVEPSQNREQPEQVVEQRVKARDVTTTATAAEPQADTADSNTAKAAAPQTAESVSESKSESESEVESREKEKARQAAEAHARAMQAKRAQALDAMRANEADNQRRMIEKMQEQQAKHAEAQAEARARAQSKAAANKEEAPPSASPAPPAPREYAMTIDEGTRKWIWLNVNRNCEKYGIAKRLVDDKNYHPALALRELDLTPKDEWLALIAGAVAVPAPEKVSEARAHARRHFHNGECTLVDERYRFGDPARAQLYIVDDFLSAADCERTIALMKTRMKPSTITASPNTPDPGKERTSSTGELSQIMDPFVDVLDAQISNLVGIRREFSEGIQGQWYQTGQEFKKHTDFFSNDRSSAEYKANCSRLGQRTWTVMVYLNDVADGGETNFVRLGHSVRPKRGRAVVWNNLRPDDSGVGNEDTMHWGQPPHNGAEKYIITKWFREEPEPNVTVRTHTPETTARLAELGQQLFARLQQWKTAHKAAGAANPFARPAADATAREISDHQQAQRRAQAKAMADAQERTRALALERQRAAAVENASGATQRVPADFTMRKALWTLRLLRECDAMNHGPRFVDESRDLVPFERVRDDYLAANRPLILRRAGQNGGWDVDAWTFDMLRERIGHARVQVQSGRSKDPNFEYNKVRHHETMRFSEFMDKLEQGPANDVYLTANNSNAQDKDTRVPLNRTATRPVLASLCDLRPSAKSTSYLRPGSVPQSAFLWVGNEGGFTPLHHDEAQIFHVQMRGRKEWRICSPIYAPVLANFARVFCKILDPWNIDYDEWPEARCVKWYDFELGPGDAIILPEGWLHAVRCFDENISISSTDWSPGIKHVGDCP